MQRLLAYLIDRLFIKRPVIRRLVTHLLEGDRNIDLQLLGTQLRVNSVEEHGYLRAYRTSRMNSLFRDELPVLINLAGILRDGDTFVDVGANVGMYCLTLARFKQIYPNVAIYAFEANAGTFSRLSENAHRLGVIAHNIALSDHDGQVEFVSGAVSHVFTTAENRSDYSIAGERTLVPCKRLDEFDIRGDSIVMKIDVEGQEKDVLDGAEQLFRDGRIRAVYLDGYKDRNIEGLLLDYGFNFLEGRTLRPATGSVFSLLAVKNDPQHA